MSRQGVQSSEHTQPWTLRIDQWELGVALESFHGIQSAPHGIDVLQVTTQRPSWQVAPEKLVGRTCYLARVDAPERMLGDVVASELSVDSTGDRLHFEVSPSLARLATRSTSRLFREVSIVDVTTTLLREHGVPYELQLSREYPVRDHIIQQRQADIELLLRLWSEEGLFSFLDARGGLVVADSADAYPQATIELQMNLGGAQSALRASSNRALWSFALQHRRATRAVVSRRYDVNRPDISLEVASSVERRSQRLESIESGRPEEIRPGELYEHQRCFDEESHNSFDAEVALDALRRDVEVLRGSTNCDELHPGCRVRLRSAGSVPEREFVVVRVEHELATREGRTQYRNRFRAVPSSVPYRLTRPQTTSQKSYELATVWSPSSDPVHVDHLGRVRVHFHWQRSEPGPTSTCWVRVAQYWAGAGFGSQHAPRAGSEVVVAFNGSDDDHPIVVGSLYNGRALPPFRLPDERTRSGVVGASTGSSGSANQIWFDDAGLEERMVIEAARDLEVRASMDRRIRIEGSDRLEVGGVAARSAEALTTNVALDLRLQTGGDHCVHVGGNRELFTGGRTIEQHQGHWVAKYEAPRVEMHRASHDVRVDGDYRHHTHGNATLSVGRHGFQRSLAVAVEGVSTYRSTGVLALESDEEIVLRCGASRLRMSGAGIDLSGPAIRLVHDDVTLAIDEGGISLMALGNAAVMGQGGMVLKGAGGATLQLATEAKLDGSQVLLNSPAEAGDDVLKPPEPLTEIVLEDPDGRPIPSAPFVVVHADGTKHAGVLDNTGRRRLYVPEDASVEFPSVHVARPKEG